MSEAVRDPKIKIKIKEVNTYLTCFPANKYVFSIRTRFTADGCDVWDGGVDTDAWKLAQSVSRCLIVIMRPSSARDGQDGDKKKGHFLCSAVSVLAGVVSVVFSTSSELSESPVYGIQYSSGTTGSEVPSAGGT